MNVQTLLFIYNITLLDISRQVGFEHILLLSLIIPINVI